GVRVSLLALEAFVLAAASIAVWRLAGALLVGTLVAVAAASHAAAVHPTALGITVDALHLVAAAAWAGGIMALFTFRPPGGWRQPEGRALLQRFSQVAIPAFLASVAFGAIQGLQEVHGAISRMWTTSYGQVLLLK